jgi:homoserine kinase type II
MGDHFDANLARELVAGYESVRTLESRERDAMRAELSIAALRFTTTRITDFALRQVKAGEDRVMKDWRRFYRRYREVATMEAWWGGTPGGGRPSL